MYVLDQNLGNKVHPCIPQICYIRICNSGVSRTRFPDEISIHYENMPMQYTEIFKVAKKENTL